ncbi:hypothetical protein Ddye_015449, partial [Dipteronia dyeriana]
VVFPKQFTICKGASAWPDVVLLGDLNKITIGFCSNVHERCVIQATWSLPIEVSIKTSIERLSGIYPCGQE